MDINKETESATEFEVVTLTYAPAIESFLYSSDSDSSLCSWYTSTPLIQETVELVSDSRGSIEEALERQTNRSQVVSHLQRKGEINLSSSFKCMKQKNPFKSENIWKNYCKSQDHHSQLLQSINNETTGEHSGWKGRLNNGSYSNKRLSIDDEEECFASRNVSQHVDSKSCTEGSEIFWTAQDKEFTSETSFKCVICEKIFDSLNGLTSHLLRFHSVKELHYGCNTSTESVYTKTYVLTDTRDIRLQRRYSWDYCYQYYSSGDLKAISQHKTLLRRQHGNQRVSEYYSSKTSVEDSVEYSTEGEEPESKVGSEGSVKCVICGNVFRNIVSLNTHQLFYHPKNIRYFCIFCNKSYASKCGLQYHLRGHIGIKQKCRHCNQLFSQDGLRRHLRLLCNRRTHKCPLCPKSYAHSFQLKMHLDRKHKQGRPQPCDVCGKIFYTTQCLKQHTKTHPESEKLTKWDPNRYKCNRCEKTFRDSRYLQKHLSKQNGCVGVPGVSCRECGQSYTTSGDLYTHFRKKHGEKLKGIPKGFMCKYIVKEEECSFMCEFCGRMFRNSQYFQDHLHFHLHGQKYLCAHCGKKYYLKGSLRKHVRIYHNSRKHKQDLRQQCHICGKMYSGQCLKQHIKSHSESETLTKWDSNRYKCHRCEKIFSQTKYLERHLSKVNGCAGVPAVSCQECGNAYTNSRDLVVHFKKKHGEKLKGIPRGSMTKYIVKEDEVCSIMCEQCGKFFRDRHSFQRHLNFHLYGHAKHICPHCGNTYNFKCSLQEHIMKNHSASHKV